MIHFLFGIPSLKLTCPLKMDGRKMYSLLKWSLFWGYMLILGSVHPYVQGVNSLLVSKGVDQSSLNSLRSSVQTLICQHDLTQIKFQNKHPIPNIKNILNLSLMNSSAHSPQIFTPPVLCAFIASTLPSQLHPQPKERLFVTGDHSSLSRTSAKSTRESTLCPEPRRRRSWFVWWRRFFRVWRWPFFFVSFFFWGGVLIIRIHV